MAIRFFSLFRTKTLELSLILFFLFNFSPSANPAGSTLKEICSKSSAPLLAANSVSCWLWRYSLRWSPHVCLCCPAEKTMVRLILLKCRPDHVTLSFFCASHFTMEEVKVLETAFEALPKRSLEVLWPTPDFASSYLLQLHSSSSRIGIILLPDLWTHFSFSLECFSACPPGCLSPLLPWRAEC